jgi:hypothetical protein
MKITPVYSPNDPDPAINARVPIRVEMEHQGMKLCFTATDAVSAWADDSASIETAKDLLAVMLHTITAESP